MQNWDFNRGVCVCVSVWNVNILAVIKTVCVIFPHTPASKAKLPTGGCTIHNTCLHLISIQYSRSVQTCK